MFEILFRLSEQISLKLADNNPNIADLSDVNRPTNLADKFSMLYDDEWTEAFDALQNIPEFQEDEQAIKQLLEILLVRKLSLWAFLSCIFKGDFEMV